LKRERKQKGVKRKKKSTEENVEEVKVEEAAVEDGNEDQEEWLGTIYGG
jgi:hypothetical protein